MAIRCSAVPPRRTFVPGALVLFGALVVAGCGDGSTVDNPDEASPATSATVLSKVATNDPTTTEPADDDVTTTTSTTRGAAETTTSTIVSTTTSTPGKTLVLVAPPSTIRSTTSSTAAPATTSPPATTGPATTAAPAVSVTTPPATAVPTSTSTSTSTTAAPTSASQEQGESDASPTGSGSDDSAEGQADTDGDTTGAAEPDSGAVTDAGEATDADNGDDETAGAESDDGASAALVSGVVSRPTCAARPDSGGRVACTAVLRNETDVFTRMSTSVAFFDGTGTQLSSESRFMNYVAPGEVYVQQFYGPATTARADVLASIPTAIAEPQTGESRTGARGVYLPVDSSVVEIGDLSPDALGRQTSVVTVENSSESAGTVTVKVAFFDADGVRVSNESRFVQGIEPGAPITQKFFGDPSAASIQILEINVVPSS